jgi:4'-phosphopantetheinyl transferase
VPEVRWFDIRGMTLSNAELASLGPQERARAAAFSFAADRHRYQAAHVALRQVLSRRTGIPPGQLEFGREPCPRCGGRNGRPTLVNHGDLHFSMSHSADAVVIASSAAPVGIDMERIVRRCSCDLAGAMHEADAARVRRLPEPRRHVAIMRWWVAAEAVLKCTGAGIAHGMADFPVLGGPASGEEEAASRAAGACGLAQRTAGCWLLAVAAPPGYTAAIALRAAGPCAPVVYSLRAGTRPVGSGRTGGAGYAAATASRDKGSVQ